RHTRSLRDWSSDVCSSDLNFSKTLRLWKKHETFGVKVSEVHGVENVAISAYLLHALVRRATHFSPRPVSYDAGAFALSRGESSRSEERRVGKECRYRRSRL